MSLHSYTAGLNLQFTKTQVLNGLGWVMGGTACYLLWPGPNHIKKVEKEGGRRIEPPRNTRVKAQILTSAHGLGFLASAAVFLVALPLNRFVTPDWLAKCQLPPPPSPLIHTSLRAVCCIGSVATALISARAIKHLGSQWNYFGLRERPKVVTTGPYSIVRHPMYSCGILLEVCFAGMFWNWVPLAVLGTALIPAFAFKIPMEEQAILESKIGKQYKVYQKLVPWRVVPYLW